MAAESQETDRSTSQQVLGLVVWLIGCFAAAALGAFFPPDDWYAGLTKPTWSPPDKVFGPVWTILYTCMAVAAWLIWRQRQAVSKRLPLAVFGVQLALNATWSWLFFGLHRIDLALLNIGMLLVAVAATAILFSRASIAAGLLLVPYLAWVAFAAALNVGFWQING